MMGEPRFGRNKIELFDTKLKAEIRQPTSDLQQLSSYESFVLKMQLKVSKICSNFFVVLCVSFPSYLLFEEWEGFNHSLWKITFQIIFSIWHR
jgi:hypothetical protein